MGSSTEESRGNGVTCDRSRKAVLTIKSRLGNMVFGLLGVGKYAMLELKMLMVVALALSAARILATAGKG